MLVYATSRTTTMHSRTRMHEHLHPHTPLCPQARTTWTRHITHIHHSHIHRTHTHKLTHTHAHATHIHYLHTCIHINSPTIAFPSLSYFLFPYSLTHSLTCACTYIHTHTEILKKSPTITPPSLLYFLFPSCFSMLSLSLEKLVTCGVIRSYNY